MSADHITGLEFIHASAAVTGVAFVASLGVAFAPQIVRRLSRQPLVALIAVNSSPGESASGRVDIQSVRHEELERRAASAKAGLRRIGKRAFDLLAALSLLVFLSPLLIATAIAIRLDSPGPVLYRQRRVGLNGQAFDIYKFRSMRNDAEKNGACWAEVNDQRVTRVGRLIRRTRIDEIPQAINIMKGDMSFVGPRPERPEFVSLLESAIPNYHERHLVKPGITGWAQVKYVYTASVEGARNKLGYDLFYVKHMSPLLDILIVLMTVRVALFGVGSR